MFANSTAQLLMLALCLGTLSCKNKEPVTAEEQETHAELQVLNEEFKKAEAELRELKGGDATMSMAETEKMQKTVLGLTAKKDELQKEVQALKADFEKYKAANL